MFLWLFLLIHQQAPAVAPWWVVAHADGAIERQGVAPETADPTEEPPLAIWYGAPGVAPRRLSPAEAAAPPAHRDPHRLTVEALGWSEEMAGAKLELIAAPVAMWLDAPEELLPRRPLGRDGRVRLPWQPAERWRVRVVGDGIGSWWLDLAPGQARAEVSLFSSAVVLMQLVGPDGNPVGQAEVSVSQRGADAADAAVVLARFRTETGSFELPSLPDGFPMTLTAAGPGWLPKGFSGLAPDVPPRWVLERGATLAGRFVDGQHRPLADVRVIAEGWALGSPVPLRHEVRSDGTGRWVVENLPTGGISLGAGKPGFAPLVRQVNLPAGGVELGAIQLLAGLEQSVLVRGEEGEPIAGATVAIRAGHPRTTDADGRATLVGLAAGRPNEIFAEAPRHLPGKVLVRPPLPEELEVRLFGALVVSGRYLDEGGKPLPEATYTLAAGSGTRREPLASNGAFELTLEPGRRFELELASASSQVTKLAIEPGQAGEHRDLGEIRARMGRWVAGRLVRSEDGESVVGARISAPRAVGPQAISDRLRGNLLTAVSDAEGRFRVNGLSLFGSSIRVEAPGRARLATAIPPGVEGLDLGEIELEGGVEVHLYAEGLEQGDAAARLDLGNRWAETDMLSAPLVEGWATFRHVPAGRAIASVVRGRELICDTEIEVPATGTLEVECDSTGMRVAGLVTVGGASPGGGTLLWLPAATELPGLVIRHSTPLGAERSEAFGAGRPQVDVPVEPGGAFFAEDLRPGAWQVIFAAEEGWMTSSLRVDLPAGEEHRIELPFPGQGLAGRVIDVEGERVRDARVRELVSGIVTTTDEAGRFQLLGLSTGEAFLRADSEGRSSAALAVEITAEASREPVTLILRDSAEDRLLVRVVDRDHRPAAGALIFVELPGRGLRILTAANDGGASMPIDPPYPARLRVAALTEAGWVLGSWTPWGEALDQPPLLVAEPTGSLRIRTGETRGLVEVASASGWNVSALARRAGLPVVVSPGEPLLFTGLPEGTYSLAVAATVRAFTIESGQEVTIELD